MAFSIVLAASLTMAGAEIRGTFEAPRCPSGAMVLVGYVGRTPSGKILTDHAGVTAGPGERSARCDTFRPRFTEVSVPEGGPARFRIGSLPAGNYIVYGRLGETRMVWSELHLAAGQRASLKLRAVPTNRAALQVRARNQENALVWLQPCRPDGKSLLPGLKPAEWHLERELAGGSCEFPDLEAGPYAVTLVAYREIRQNDEEPVRVLLDRGTWTVRVPPGKRLTIQLPPK